MPLHELLSAHRVAILEESGDRDAVLDAAARLLADGIPVARRTVAKYREAMNIPSSTERQRL